MNKSNTRKKECPPSSLFHYTKLDSLECILPSKPENIINGIPYMDFRLSHPAQCNDPLEFKFFEDSLYTGSEISNSLKNEIEQVRGTIGEPFILCLIRHKQAEITKCPMTEIPMWNMYGDKGQGVRLRLDYKLLKRYCETTSIQLFKCSYLNGETMRQETEKVRKKYSNGEFSSRKDYEDVYKRFVAYKKINWNYEYEHRMVVWTNNYETMDDKRYVHIKIPLSVLKTIQIGPSAPDDSCIKQINEMLIQMRYIGCKVDFKVERSKLLIRF